MLLLALHLILALVQGHGWMTMPAPRNSDGGQALNEIPIKYESGSDAFDEVGFTGGSAGTKFVCRDYAKEDISTTLTAGDTVDVSWDMSAAHDGGCSIYFSYDRELAPGNMKWFKIGNRFPCNDYKFSVNQFALPSWLPAGEAVMRWEWYATHLYPAIEFYTQCVDVEIINNSGETPPSDLEVYTLIQPEVLWPNDDENTAPNYRYYDTTGDVQGWMLDYFMSGPACASGITAEGCAYTEAGSYGNFDTSANAVLWSEAYSATDDDDDDTVATEEPLNEGVCLYRSIVDCEVYPDPLNGAAQNNANFCELYANAFSANGVTSYIFDVSTNLCTFCTNTDPQFTDETPDFYAGIWGSTDCPEVTITVDDTNENDDTTQDDGSFQHSLYLVFFGIVVQLFS